MTQQVGAENDRELVELLLSKNIELPFPNQYLKIKEKELRDNHFEIIESGEVFQPIKFYDVGALVWFARIIEWEFLVQKICIMLKEFLKKKELLKVKFIDFTLLQEKKIKFYDF